MKTDFKTFLKWFRNTDVYDVEMSRKERDGVQIDSKTYSCMFYIGLRLKNNDPVHKIILDLPDDLKYLMKEAIKLHFNKNKKLITDWADANYELIEALIHNSSIDDEDHRFLYYPFRVLKGE